MSEMKDKNLDALRASMNKFKSKQDMVFMSPVSPVFHTEVTVSIGLLRPNSEWEDPFYICITISTYSILTAIC